MSEKRRDGAGRRVSALSLPDWPLRRKLALALAIPMVLAATFGGLRVANELGEADNYSATARQVTVLRPAVAYLAAAERAVITSRERTALDDEERLAAIAAVASAGEALETAGRDADLTGEQSDRLASVLDLSSQLRGSVGYASVGQSVSQIRQLQRSTNELIDAIINAQIRPEPRLAMLSQVIDGRVSLAMQQYQVAGAGGADANPVDLAAELGVEAATLDRLAASLGSTQEQVLALNQQNAAHFGEVRNGGRALGSTEAFDQYDVLTSDLLDGIDRQLSAAATESRGLAVVNSVITVALLLAAILLALFVARLLLNPVRRLREGALEVANERLPDAVATIRAGGEPAEITPIDVTTREEMGQLARAVDDLHRQAVVLASGEARVRQQVGDMFTTLSRRNTSLINQQLGLIERLEKDEEDPKRLESLFRLDHLASRMRRTSDSLMVLADAPGAGGEQSALTLGDVLQAAMAGVQDYQRVQIESTPSEKVHGGAASDVVHLMTELVDNALAFSPPTAPVRITTKRVGESVLVEIGDGGLGIAPDILEALNADLSGGGEVTPETARRMGLLVVSRLAKRHGITVSLARNTRGGTTATVLLPPALLRERVLAPAPSLRSVPAVEKVSVEELTNAPEVAKRTGLFGRGRKDKAPAPTPPVEADEPVRPAAPVAAAPSADRPGLPQRRQPAEKPTTSPTPTPTPAARALPALPTRPAPVAQQPAAAAQDNQPAKAGSDAAPQLPVDSIEAAINAVIRLPQRQPGAIRSGGRAMPGAPSGPQGGSLFQRPKPAEPVEPVEPVAEVESVAEVEPVAEAEPAAAVETLIEIPAPIADPEPGGELELASVLTHELRQQSEDEAATVLETVATPLEAAPALDAPAAPELPERPEPVVSSSPLDASTPFAQTEDDSPIFRSLQSNWFTAGGSDDRSWAPTEVDAGWQAAEQVADAPAPQLSRSGLPVRRPGGRLVPGGVTPPAAVVTRDPEAIRARLAAHAAGVSRGRSTIVEDPHPEEAGPA